MMLRRGEREEKERRKRGERKSEETGNRTRAKECHGRIALLLEITSQESLKLGDNGLSSKEGGGIIRRKKEEGEREKGKEKTL